MNQKRIVFKEKKRVELEEYEVPVLKSNEVGVRVIYSLMSTGTENIAYNYDIDPGTHWESWVKYPFYPGYACVGQVNDIGKDVDKHLLGKHALVRCPHGTYAVAPSENTYLLPNKIDLKESSWFSYAKICFMGMLAGELKLGENVLIIGAGPIGQILARWLLISGVRNTTVVDISKFRLEFLSKLKILTVNDSVGKKLLNENKILKDGFDVVFDCTGNHLVLSMALDVVINFGKDYFR